MRKWIPIIILASGEFVMTLDTSVMNVSISQITADLNTSIQGVQAAITLYALVMAALMLTGAKLGDIYGRNRMFAIGLAVYGVGSLTTALSPNLTVLLVGWSGIEGLGAIMVIPGIAALTAANYEGKDRALAYALIGGITAVAVAAGPLIGGWVTTNASWRYVFAGETVIVTGDHPAAGADRARRRRPSTRQAGRHRVGALRRRPGTGRLRDPDGQQVGIREAARGTDDQRTTRSPRSASRWCPSWSWPGWGYWPGSSTGRSAGTAWASTASWTRPCSRSRSFAPGSPP